MKKFPSPLQEAQALQVARLHLEDQHRQVLLSHRKAQALQVERPLLVDQVVSKVSQVIKHKALPLSKEALPQL